MSKATIYDVAEQAGVSVRTVSRCLKNSSKVAPATAERVRAAVADLGYRPNVYANRISRSEQKVMAVMAGFRQGQALNNLHRLLLSHISCDLCARGQDLLLIGVDSDNEERVIRESLQQEKFSSLLLLTIPSDRVMAELAVAPFPKVTLNWMPEKPMSHHTYVGIDYVGSSREYVKALAEHGCRSVLYVAPHECERKRGAEEGAKEAGIEFEHLVSPWPCEPMPVARQTVKQVMARSSLPDVLYFFSDEMALAFMSAAKEVGLRVPEDVKVCGFDGYEGNRYVTPSLTTMAQPWQGMARKAVEFLLESDREEVMEGKRFALPTELIWGDSC
jgi:LacI family transcriptional regulator